ncbi:MAG: DUF3846 domain-containing protein [Chloroflexi bacterium]|nr:DUF3846 domain-containing protein [Chloroflexota bacterium]
MRALLIPADPDAAVREVQIDDSAGDAAQLARFQELVGGYIEQVPFPGRSDVTAFVNEHGKHKNLAVNDRASRLLGRAAQLGDWIAGDCLLTGFDPAEYSTIELPSDLRTDTLHVPARKGRLVPPYPVEHCAAADCQRPLRTREDAAYLYTDQDSGKLVVFCEDCAAHVELNHPLRFKLVAL